MDHGIKYQVCKSLCISNDAIGSTATVEQQQNKNICAGLCEKNERPNKNGPTKKNNQQEKPISSIAFVGRYHTLPYW